MKYSYSCDSLLQLSVSVTWKAEYKQLQEMIIPCGILFSTTTQLGAPCSFVEQIAFPKSDIPVLHNYRSYVLCFRPRLKLSVNTQIY